MTKPQDQPTTMIATSAGTPSKYTTSILMAGDPKKIGKRISGHPRKKGVRGPSTTGQTNTTRDGASQAKVVIMVVAHLSLRTACTMTTIPTTAQKIA
jgi:hypothetical protein